MFLWLETALARLKPGYGGSDEKQPDDDVTQEEEQDDIPRRDPDDFSQYFNTHRMRKSHVYQELLQNPFPVTPSDFKMADSATDDIDNTQPAKSAFRIGRQLLPDSLFIWYVSQSFIGYQTCAFIAQNWLVDRACSLKGRDAVKAGFDIISDHGEEVEAATIQRIEALNKRFKLKKELTRADKFKNIFGISHVLFLVDSEDPDYYEKPFNPDGIRPGSYRGITHIDPYWITPLLTTDSVENPESQGFYEPTYWYVAGQKYHCSHFVILRGPEVSDVLKPSYLYGGLPLTQLIAERVYAAERTANEAPQLALTKRLVIRYIEKLEQALANQEKFEESMMALSEWRDNFGVYVSSANDRIEQQDTSLSDLDVTIMTQYQIVSGQSGIPATKLMGTSPKGFSATGEHEIKSYHEELESIQENDLTPIIDRHHICLMRSHVAPRLLDKQPIGIEIQWRPLAVMSAKEDAETQEVKARTYKTVLETGAVDSYDIRDAIIADEESGFSGIEAIERPEDLDDLPELDELLEIGEEAPQAALPAPTTEGKDRDYKKEYRDYHSNPDQVENRTKRNAARREMGLKKGDPREVDHKNPLSNGGSNNTNNLRAVKKSTNREKGSDEEAPQVTGDVIRKKGSQWYVQSKQGKALGGPYLTKKQALSRLKEVEGHKTK